MTDKPALHEIDEIMREADFETKCPRCQRETMIPGYLDLNRRWTAVFTQAVSVPFFVIGSCCLLCGYMETSVVVPDYFRDKVEQTIEAGGDLKELLAEEGPKVLMEELMRCYRAQQRTEALARQEPDFPIEIKEQTDAIGCDTA